MSNFKVDSEQGMHDSRTAALRDKAYLINKGIVSPDVTKMTRIVCGKTSLFFNKRKMANINCIIENIKEKYGKIDRIVNPTGEIIVFGDGENPEDVLQVSCDTEFGNRLRDKSKKCSKGSID